MFMKKIEKLFSNMSNVFSIADDILTEDFDMQGRDHDETLDNILLMCRQSNLKLSKEKYLFR